MSFYDHYALDEDHIHEHCNHHLDFEKSKSSSRPSNSCEFCSSHWGTKIRIFKSYEDFEKSEFYGGEDKVINDANGVTIAVWTGKNNVGRSPDDWWLCTPIHPLCGCELDTFSFKKGSEPQDEELEDWYSKLEWD